MCSLLRRLLLSPLIRILFWGSLLCAIALGHPTQVFHVGTPAIAQDAAPAQLVQDGVDAYSQGDYAAAITAWSQALSIYPTTAISERALVNENLARTYQHIGDTQASIKAWEAAATAYEQADNPVQYGRMLTEQAQVYISLGQHQRAAALLCGSEPTITSAAEDTSPPPPLSYSSPFIRCEGGAVSIAQSTQDAAGQTAALGSLAETYRLRGDDDTAQVLLLAGLELANTEGLSQYEAPLLTSLGNTYARLSQVAMRRAAAAELLNKRSVAERLQTEAKVDRDQALTNLTKAVDVAQTQADGITELRSHLSLLAVYQAQEDTRAATTSQQRLGQLINQLPPSRDLAYATVALAKSYQVGRSFDCPSYRESPQVETWLETGRRIAAAIGDNRAASFALGELGHLEECRGDLETAAALTNQAQLAASDALASADSLYLWEWQIGRIDLLQGQPTKALAAYSQSIATLESIRTDILTADRELQFDFRDTVEPIYRQYIELQLAASPDAAVTSPVEAIDAPRVTATLDTVDALRLAELQNFFGNDCVLVPSEGARERLLRADSQTAVISSIVLSDRTVLIASFPDGSAKTTWIENTETLRQTAAEFRRKLKRFRDLGGYDKRPAQALYQQLIGAFEADFTRANIDTLVFIHDGFLRNIPMAALHDGTQYLIQRYAVATTPSLSLTAPAQTRPADLRALAVGLSEATVTASGREFSALNFVPAELAAIAEQLPGSTTLLDAAFTVDELKSALQQTQYPILHLATHGQFSTIPEDTFVVTGANDLGIAEELTFGQIEALIRETSPNAEPISLITLTACETATGDDRATLGLAGVAIRAGATSAIASLWKVNDATAAQLIESFYGHLKDPTLSKAQALQAAQIDAINAASASENPGYWAPLILVGNWQ